jgi:hypothetical protein
MAVDRVRGIKGFDTAAELTSCNYFKPQLSS